jgi:hypothetical protein
MAASFRSYRMNVLLAASAIVTAACGGSSEAPTAPPTPVATTVQAVTATTQQAHVGQPVGEPPGVRVRDQFNNPMGGVTVLFVVASGDGTVTPTQVATGTNGEAHLTSWVLGPGTGANSVRATVTGVPEVFFSATGVRFAANVVAASATNQTAPAGANVAEPPTVRVTDVNGNPLNGVVVTFVVTSGGGNVTTTPQVTDVDGFAGAASWTLGTTPGVNTVTATVANVGQVVFSATGTAAPSTLTAQSASQQTARVSTAVAEPPTVLVRDQGGTPMAGVTVTFAVTSGGGSVIPENVATSSEGIAQLTRWVLGPAAGTNTVVATVPGVTPVTFSATGISCPTPTIIAIGGTVNGNLGASGCTAADGAFVELYQFTVATTSAVRVAQSSAAFDSYLHLLRGNGEPVAEDDDAQSGGTLNSEIFALLEPGTYVIGASSFLIGATGAFSLTLETTSADITDCTVYFVTRNIASAQSLSATDCLFGGFRTDLALVYLNANQQVTISMNSAAVDSWLGLYSDPFDFPVLVAENDDKSATTLDAEIVYTPTTAGYFFVEFSSAEPGQTGAYTFSIVTPVVAPQPLASRQTTVSGASSGPQLPIAKHLPRTKVSGDDHQRLLSDRALLRADKQALRPDALKK